MEDKLPNRFSETWKNNIITYQDFEKVDIRVGKIINVEDFPNGGKMFLISHFNRDREGSY